MIDQFIYPTLAISPEFCSLSILVINASVQMVIASVLDYCNFSPKCLQAHLLQSIFLYYQLILITWLFSSFKNFQCGPTDFRLNFKFFKMPFKVAVILRVVLWLSEWMNDGLRPLSRQTHEQRMSHGTEPYELQWVAFKISEL
jgi:hypothetical protein